MSTESLLTRQYRYYETSLQMFSSRRESSLILPLRKLISQVNQSQRREISWCGRLSGILHAFFVLFEGRKWPLFSSVFSHVFWATVWIGTKKFKRDNCVLRTVQDWSARSETKKHLRLEKNGWWLPCLQQSFWRNVLARKTLKKKRERVIKTFMLGQYISAGSWGFLLRVTEWRQLYQKSI